MAEDLGAAVACVDEEAAVVLAGGEVVIVVGPIRHVGGVECGAADVLQVGEVEAEVLGALEDGGGDLVAELRQAITVFGLMRTAPAFSEVWLRTSERAIS